MSFNCKLCNYITEKKCNYNKHITTIKHKNKEFETTNKLLENQKNFICNKCNKQLSTKQKLNNHTLICRGVSSLLECSKCNKKFNKSITRYVHEKKCTNSQIVPFDNKISNITNSNITNNTTNNIDTQNNNTEDIIQTNNIEEIIQNDNINVIENPISQLIQFNSLLLNDIIITSRKEDNFINATLLCQAGNKRFNDWYRLNTTKELIKELKADMGIPISEIIDKKNMKADAGIPVSGIIEINKGGNDKSNQGTWIHPDLSIQLAQWISPSFALQVSKWIRTLFSNGQISIDKKILYEKDQRIKLLENTYLKKHKREDYKEHNVIYMLTTKDYKEQRIYIIGKAKDLKSRLSTYNKTIDHEVIYYKKCKDENTMNIIEKIILNKLNNYREIANRDRFILPIEKDITFFTTIIDDCIFFCNKQYC